MKRSPTTKNSITAALGFLVIVQKRFWSRSSVPDLFSLNENKKPANAGFLFKIHYVTSALYDKKGRDAPL